jgi:hypothetical protein
MAELVAIRALVLDLNFSAHGLPATVIRPAPDDERIDTRVIWIVDTPIQMPSGGFQRVAAVRIAAIRRDAVPTMPVGTIIEAAVLDGADVQRWIVTDIDQQDVDHHRAMVQETRDGL